GLVPAWSISTNRGVAELDVESWTRWLSTSRQPRRAEPWFPRGQGHARLTLVPGDVTPRGRRPEPLTTLREVSSSRPFGERLGGSPVSLTQRWTWNTSVPGFSAWAIRS